MDFNDDRRTVLLLVDSQLSYKGDLDYMVLWCEIAQAHIQVRTDSLNKYYVGGVTGLVSQKVLDEWRILAELGYTPAKKYEELPLDDPQPAIRDPESLRLFKATG